MRKSILYRFITIISMLAVLLLNACSNTHLIQPDEPIHVKKFGTLFKKDFKWIDVSEFYTTIDSIIALDRDTNELIQYHKSNVKKIVMWNRSKGSRQGALMGAVGASSIIYFLVPEHPEDALGSKESGAFIWFFFGGTLGSVVGAISGSNDIYEFIEPIANNIQSIGDSTLIGEGKPKSPSIIEVKEPMINENEIKKK